MSHVMTTDSRNNKNAIINGDFDIWQRGVSFASPSGEYTADRWLVRTVFNDGAATVSRESFTPGQTDVPGEPRHYLRIDQTESVDSVMINMQQRIEDIRTFAGQKVMLSLYARGTPGKVFVVRLRQRFGTGGAPSSIVTKSVGTVTLSADWQEFKFAVDVPSIAGKTLGTDGNSCLGLEIHEDVVSAFALDIASVKMGSVSGGNNFIRRTLAEELSLCQRYFRNTGELKLVFSKTTISPYENISTHPVTMRATPTATVNNYVDLDSSGRTISDVSVDKNSINGLSMSGSVSAGSRFRFDVDLDAEL